LPAVIEQMMTELWTATKVLLGLRYQAKLIEQLLQGVRAMKESTTYQAIKAEGRLEEVRRLLFRVGEERFVTGPTPEQQAVIEAITDADRLEELVIRTLHVGTWAELLDREGPPRRVRRKKSP
jgi:hypothetical protein